MWEERENGDEGREGRSHKVVFLPILSLAPSSQSLFDTGCNKAEFFGQLNLIQQHIIDLKRRMNLQHHIH